MPAPDFSTYTPGLDSPPVQSVAVMLHDSDALPWEPRALWIGTGGTLVARLRDDAADCTFQNIPAGSYLLGAFRLLKATGSTVSGVVALR